jgi:adenosylcobinamide kinase/adenosylcobinamide-phosphate guanylyltransferase
MTPPHGPVKTLILGGVRSGKSRYAGELAGAQACPVTLIVTGSAGDEEMAARIEMHRMNRPSHWIVVEEPVHLAAALRSTATASPDRVIVVDCLTLWLSNLLCAADEDSLRCEAAALLEVLPTLPCSCILVTNEVGHGIIPVNALARRFADESGALHQRLAAICDRVVLMVAGVPLPVKSGVTMGFSRNSGAP